MTYINMIRECDAGFHCDYYVEEVVNYLKKKKAYEYGFIKYSNFKKLISHITKINKSYHIRKIFLVLGNEGYFIKKKNNNVNSYLYKFKSQKDLDIKNQTITISFD